MTGSDPKRTLAASRQRLAATSLPRPRRTVPGRRKRSLSAHSWAKSVIRVQALQMSNDEMTNINCWLSPLRRRRSMRHFLIAAAAVVALGTSAFAQNGSSTGTSGSAGTSNSHQTSGSSMPNGSSMSAHGNMGSQGGMASTSKRHKKTSTPSSNMAGATAGMGGSTSPTSGAATQQ